ncbi:hypothetical protein DMH04_10460 [Kibdelosporangium aridum]|uniref:Uncharacterized protein n=1 Tax=Kibdelosporangium aridum TaxID=2030 RepID=A0A428ZHB1_KIBAR|nr:DUF6338 family protein [Kibdelosporangium aridum]RSM87445.1 hypothetical protein DMH04_10460 [Kibdelosporangium aridum]
MVPSTAAAVVVFLLLVTPGIAFELLWQRTRPRRDESTFIEISRVLLAGVVFSGSATVVVAVAAAVVPGSAADPAVLLRDGNRYMTEHPRLVLVTLAATVLLALCAAVATHALLTPPMRRIAQETVWHTAFSRMAPTGARVFLSVQLKDGTTITGYTAGYSTEPDPAKRDLLLVAPLTIRPPGAAEPDQLTRSWQTLVVAGGDISTIAAAYVSTTRPSMQPRRGLLAWLARHAWQASLGVALVIVLALLVAGLAGR